MIIWMEAFHHISCYFMPKFTGNINDTVLGVRQKLQQAGILLINGNPREAISLIQHAIDLEKGALGLLEQLRDLEKQMLSHTKKEINMGRRAEVLAYS